MASHVWYHKCAKNPKSTTHEGSVWPKSGETIRIVASNPRGKVAPRIVMTFGASHMGNLLAIDSQILL